MCEDREKRLPTEPAESLPEPSSPASATAQRCADAEPDGADDGAVTHRDDKKSVSSSDNAANKVDAEPVAMRRPPDGVVDEERYNDRALDELQDVEGDEHAANEQREGSEHTATAVNCYVIAFVSTVENARLVHAPE